METRILRAVTYDVRFPTSMTLAGSDALNPDPDYSAAYVVLETDHPSGIEGHGLTFTIGRGTEVCVAAIQALAPHLVGEVVEDVVQDLGGLWRRLVTDTQLRWLGPEKGVIHLATRRWSTRSGTCTPSSRSGRCGSCSRSCRRRSSSPASTSATSTMP